MVCICTCRCITAHFPPGLGHLSPGLGHLSPGLGHHSPGLGHLSPGLGHLSPGLGHLSPGLGHLSPGLGHLSPGLGHLSLAHDSRIHVRVSPLVNTANLQASLKRNEANSTLVCRGACTAMLHCTVPSNKKLAKVCALR